MGDEEKKVLSDAEEKEIQDALDMVKKKKAAARKAPAAEGKEPKPVPPPKKTKAEVEAAKAETKASKPAAEGLLPREEPEALDDGGVDIDTFGDIFGFDAAPVPDPVKDEAPMETPHAEAMPSVEEGSVAMRKGVMWRSTRIKYELDDFHCSVLSPMETDGTLLKTQIGFTLDMGEMQFCRLDAGIELPVMSGQIAEGYEIAWRMVIKEVVDQMLKVKHSDLYKKGK